MVITNGGSGYGSAPAVGFTGGGGAGAAATATVANGQVVSIQITAPGTGYTPDPDVALRPAVTFTGGGGTGAVGMANVGREIWPAISGTKYDNKDFFHELLGKDFQDPWYGARAFQDNFLDGTNTYNTLPQCYPYINTADEQSSSTPSYAFQWQDANTYPDKKRVTFPVIKYDFWKKITLAARGYQGIYYFKYESAHNFGRQEQKTPQPEPTLFD